MLAVIYTALGAARAWAGPPFVTDDPVPTEYRNWEIYAGSQLDAEADGELSASLPFAEFNYGAMPNVQTSLSMQLSLSARPDQEDDLARSYGSGVTELGIKTRFVQESNARPQIAFYPSVQIPGAGGGHAVTFLPLWLQKSYGPWTLYGGGGLYINPGPGMRDYTFAGATVERAISPGMTVGAELYHQGAATAGGTGTTATNVGMTAQLGRYHAILFSIGRALHGETTLSAYASYEFELGPGSSH